MNAAAAEAAVDPEVRFTVVQVVSGTPDGDVVHRFSIHDGRIEVSQGDDGDADIALLEDYDTAVALATGSLAAQQAVAEGRLKLRGDAGALVRNAETIARLQEVFARIRAETTF